VTGSTVVISAAVKARWAKDAQEYREDLQLMGLNVTGREAARRCGISLPAACLGLVRLHLAAGHSANLTAARVGISERTVVRYRRRIRTDEWANA
jgi:hypothetical protein